MSAQAHTPTPWTVRETPESSHQNYVLVGADKKRVASMDDSGRDQADAAHVVKCVNAHDELVACLRRYVEQDDTSETAGNEPWIETLHRARAILAKVGQ